MPAASQGHAPFGPEVSWPNGSASPEYPGGDYGYPATRAELLPAASLGTHPYASFDAAGYGDDGYRHPGYQGPSAQDAGISGTRTVRGVVEEDLGQAGRPGSGHAVSLYPPAGEIEIAYPPASVAAADTYHGADLYNQPWDYDQPLRYEGEDPYPAQGGYQADDHVQRGDVGQAGSDGAVRYQPPAYDPAAYNGSDYSMPGIAGPGYDLSGIIGTSDFEQVGYDEPSYRRLSYDDPRYDGGAGYADPRPRFDETRFDVPRFDETRLDNRWQAGDDGGRGVGPGGAGSAGQGSGGLGGSRSRSGSAAHDGGRSARSAETRFDLKALVEPDADSTRFDVPRFDETRLDNLRGFAPGSQSQAVGTAVLAPPASQPRNWAEDTSFDHFADLDLTDEPVPAAFTRTLDRPAKRTRPGEDTGARRAIGRRRGRSGDRRQWMALGAIAVVAAGAIGGVLMKYVFAGPSGPAHTVAAPQHVDGYSRSANLEKQMKVAAEAQTVAAKSGGQASDVVYGVYQQGSITPGSNAQIFMFVGGKLADADPGASIANFEQTYAPATVVSAGSLGGEAACSETHLNGQSASMCVWFDNDTFGTVVSPTMTTAKLASTMDTVRPNLEHYAK